MVDAPPNMRPAQQAKLDAIDFAVDDLGVRSFADLGGIGAVYGQYAFHAIDRPNVARGVLVDLETDEWMRAETARRPGLELVRANFGAAETAARVGPVDAVFLFDVLLHQVAPDWDDVIAAYAPLTSCFVVGNPQWEGERTTRLIELGRRGYLAVVPDTARHRELFDRLEETFAHFGRPFRDCPHVWQWGITDSDLTATMERHGFGVVREETQHPFWGASAFVNKTFVFSRGRP